MADSPAKDFGPIADDYAFFETHATEPEQDCRAYLESLAGLVPAAGPIRFLDFGCGSGTFTTRFLQGVDWPPERLRLRLVEPVAAARRQAVTALAGYTAHPVVDSPSLAHGTAGAFDTVLANHVLYYVPQLQNQLAALIKGLAPAGVFLTAIAPRTNALVEFWIAGFQLLGRDAPYHTSEDVETGLEHLGAAYRKEAVPYRLEFPDTTENRMRILRFLLAEHLAKIPHRPILDLFDRYSHSGRVTIRTASDHFTVRAS
jgi:trans-aconitate 2-methyltransferase